MFSLLCPLYLPGVVCSGPVYFVILVGVARGQMAYVYNFGLMATMTQKSTMHYVEAGRCYEVEFLLHAVERGELD